MLDQVIEIVGLIRDKLLLKAFNQFNIVTFHRSIGNSVSTDNAAEAAQNSSLPIVLDYREMAT